jgi:hypothetical protein
LSRHVAERFTWRAHFRPASADSIRALSAWAETTDDVTLALSPGDIGMLAVLADEASMPFFRDRAFRKELVSWMRLSRADPRYETDGLNLEALRMRAIEGVGAKAMLGTGLFAAVDALGISKALLGERSKTQSSSAIALFHRPHAESPVASGRAFYRFWLNLTRLGFAAWPLAGRPCRKCLGLQPAFRHPTRAATDKCTARRGRGGGNTEACASSSRNSFDRISGWPVPMHRPADQNLVRRRPAKSSPRRSWRSASRDRVWQ